jgi:hypothetical protein
MIRVVSWVAALLGITCSASAHEPLWGESPQTFAFGVWHPEVRFSYDNNFNLLRGARRIGNPDAMRRTRFDTLVSLQYAPMTSMNVRVEIPFSQVSTQQKIGGQLRASGVQGLGDAMLSAKSRFSQRFGEDWKEHQSFTVGLQLPTGEHGGRYPDGSKLGPSFQPGSGKWGFMLGYAYAYERLQDTFWASAIYMRDVGGAGTKGDMMTVDLNYGHWMPRATRPQDLGVIVAVGPHLELMGHDRLASGRDPDSGWTVLGLQTSIIATKGPMQFRLGVMLPVYQRVNGTQLRPDFQARAGWEILL